MSDHSTNSLYAVIGTVAAFIIGIDCAINAWYYLLIANGLFANPIVILFCALAGFLLNTALYRQDFPAACSNLVKTIQSFFVADTYYNLSFDGMMKQLVQELIAISSAIIMGLFTYNSYIHLALPHITLPCILVLSLAYVIGTYGLLREACELEKIYNRVSKLLQKSHSHPIYTSTLLLICIALFITYLAGSVYTIETLSIGAQAAISALLPHISLYIPYLIFFFLVGETIFVADKVTETLETIEEQQFPTDYTLIALIVLAVGNAVGNAAITMSDTGMLIRAVIGGILSLGVMLQAGINYLQQHQNNQADADQLSMLIVAILVGSWAYMSWAAPLVPLPPLLVISIPIVTALTLTYTFSSSVNTIPLKPGDLSASPSASPSASFKHKDPPVNRQLDFDTAVSEKSQPGHNN